MLGHGAIPHSPALQLESLWGDTLHWLASTGVLGKDFIPRFYLKYHQHRSLPEPMLGQAASVTLGVPFHRTGNHQGFFVGVGENPPLLRCSGIPLAACPHHGDCLLLGDTAQILSWYKDVVTPSSGQSPPAPDRPPAWDLGTPSPRTVCLCPAKLCWDTALLLVPTGPSHGQSSQIQAWLPLAL